MLFTHEEYQNEVKRWQNRLVVNCPICKGVGSVDKPGTTKATMCKCQENSIKNARLVASGVPRKYLDESWNWDELNNNEESKQKVKKYVENFQQNYFAGKGLYIYGRQGRGKSLMESLVAREVSALMNPDRGSNYKITFIIFEDLVKMSHEARSDISVSKKLNMIIEGSDLLIIDNVGSETGTQAYNTKFLELVLRKRDNSCVPTIISSNYTPEQIQQNYSDTIHDFILQNSELVFVQGENFRQKNQVIDEDIY
jgi:DNA replication protein